MDQSFGKWLSRARKGAGKTQEQLADHLGKHQTFISNIERGLPHNLSRADVIEIAGYLAADEDAAMIAAGYYPTRNDGEDYDLSELLEMFRRANKTDQEMMMRLARKILTPA